VAGFNNIIQTLENNRDTAYSLIRIILGIALFVRGIILMSNPSAITQLAGSEDIYWWHSYITIAHIFGGLLLALGFFSRLGALIQLPILIGAVFFIHIKQGLMMSEQSLELAVLVLVLLLIFFLFGSGPFAFDKYISEKKSENVQSA